MPETSKDKHSAPMVWASAFARLRADVFSWRREPSPFKGATKRLKWREAARGFATRGLRSRSRRKAAQRKRVSTLCLAPQLCLVAPSASHHTRSSHDSSDPRMPQIFISLAWASGRSQSCSTPPRLATPISRATRNAAHPPRECFSRSIPRIRLLLSSRGGSQSPPTLATKAKLALACAATCRCKMRGRSGERQQHRRPNSRRGALATCTTSPGSPKLLGMQTNVARRKSAADHHKDRNFGAWASCTRLVENPDFEWQSGQALQRRHRPPV